MAEITPIERAAKALYERFPHGQLVQDAQGRTALTGIPWADLGVTSRARWLEDARAAVAAIREPSETVSRAIAKAIEDTIPCDSGTDPAEAAVIVQYGVPEAVAAAMIDAMLAEGTE